jgi:hypothetical protein
MPYSSDLVICATSFEFFSKLVTLKNLTLVNPDIVVLFTLNYIPVLSGEAGDYEAPLVPVPALDSLYVEDFDRDLLKLFLILSTSYHTSFAADLEVLNNLRSLTSLVESKCREALSALFRVSILGNVFIYFAA